jgi:hypothetical protein
MTIESVYNLLPKKSNGLVSFGTIQKRYGVSTGTLNRGLEGFDTSDGITVEAFKVLITRGVITLPDPTPTPVVTVETGIGGQLAVLGSTTINQIDRFNPGTVDPQTYLLNGKLQELQALQAQNQQLASDIETLRANQTRGFEALQALTMVEAKLKLENRQLAQEKALQAIENQGLEAQLKELGILGKSPE